jgi:hypothetical protein
MDRRQVSREELFAMVWERPSEAIAKELGVSRVALIKLCVPMQVVGCEEPRLCGGLFGLCAEQRQDQVQ